MPRIAIAILAALAFFGCGDDPSEPLISVDPFPSQTTPEAVIGILEVVYRRKEPDRYGPLLRHDFVFKFQEDDAQAIGQDFWIKDEDSVGTHRLFRAPDIGDIRIDLSNSGAQDPTEPGFPEGTKWIRITPTLLEVDQAPDITLVVNGDIQDFFFLKGDPAWGERADWWYILEWRDLGHLSGVGKPSVRTTSWGRIKSGK